MYVVLLLTVLTQSPKTPVPEPSKLGPGKTAFPDLKLPQQQRTNDGKLDFKTYEVELAKLCFKDILADLPADATTLEKVQYEQVREGLAYLQRRTRFLECGTRFDALTLKEYWSTATEVYRTAIEFHRTQAGQVRCAEANIILLKEAERHTEANVECGNLDPRELNLIRFERLKAEANLLKLKGRK